MYCRCVYVNGLCTCVCVITVACVYVVIFAYVILVPTVYVVVSDNIVTGVRSR